MAEEAARPRRGRAAGCELRADRRARHLRRHLDHLAVGAAGHARCDRVPHAARHEATRTTRCLGSSPRSRRTRPPAGLQLLRRRPGGHDPDHRHERRADRHLAPVVVAGRAPPAAGHLRARAPEATAPRTSRSCFFSVLAALLLIPGKTDFLGNLYSFGAMLSFTTAHVAVVALRYQGARPRAPLPEPWNIRFRGGSLPLGCGARRHRYVRRLGVGGGAARRGAHRRHRLDGRRDDDATSATAAPRASTRRRSTGSSTTRRPRASPSWPTAPRSFRSSAPTSAPGRCGAAAKLVGEDAVVDAVYVMQVPTQLSLDAGTGRGGAHGGQPARARHGSARASRGLKVRTSADPHAQPRPGAGRRGAPARIRDHLPRHGARARRRARARADRELPAGARPCRIVIETAGPIHEVSGKGAATNGAAEANGRARRRCAEWRWRQPSPSWSVSLLG